MKRKAHFGVVNVVHRHLVHVPYCQNRFLLLRVGRHQRGYALRSRPVVNPESAKRIPLSEQVPIRQSGMGVE